MTAKYGFPLGDWIRAKNEARAILAGRARERGLISYSELAESIRAISLEPHSYAMGHFLGELSAEEDVADRGMITALVVYKDGDQLPGPGFYDLAKQRGYDVSDKEKLWIEQVKKVYSYWAEH